MSDSIRNLEGGRSCFGEGHAARKASRDRFFFIALKPSVTACPQKAVVGRLYSTTKTA